MNFYFLLLILFFTTLLPKSSSYQNTNYTNCSKRLDCGNLADDIGYPFYDGSTRPDYCGYPGFKIDNCKITISNNTYNLKGIDGDDYDRTIVVSRNDTWQSGCPDRLSNTTIDYSKFSLLSTNQNVTFFYGCHDKTNNLSVLGLETRCEIGGFGSVGGYYLTRAMLGQYKSLNLLRKCEYNLFLPVTKSREEDIDSHPGDLEAVIEAFGDGFELGVMAENSACRTCRASQGECGYDWDRNKFVCHCSDQDYDLQCGVPKRDSNTNKVAIIAGISIGVVALLALLVGGCLVFTRYRGIRIIAQEKARGIYPAQGSSSNGGGLLIQTPGSNGLTSSQAYTSTPSTNLSQSIPSYGSSKSGIGHEKTFYFGAHVFTYAELEHATCNFHDSRELGDGGFGTVYYGVLSDGRQVAVKRLYEHSAKRVEQFMNEIRILAELQHKNLVALYGCTSKSDRVLLLVYEYVPNGTVAEHIHGRLAESTFVPWLTRLSIAIQTAEALSFLHRHDVIHRDVKTANILLDNNFHVKVADFGLSRLFPFDMTHVSTAPQGTPGYVDPEYYQCYKLTEKSDVYSFGVVLIELISSKHAVDITRHRHHVNLANMALDRIQNQELHELVDPRLGFDKENSIQSMVKMVAELGFQCLQQDRDMRPTMDEVLASLVAIQVEGLKAQKQDGVDVSRVYGDDVGLLTNSTPLSPELHRSNDVV